MIIHKENVLGTTYLLASILDNTLVVYIWTESELGEYLPLSDDWSSIVSMKGRVGKILKDGQIIEQN